MARKYFEEPKFTLIPDDDVDSFSDVPPLTSCHQYEDEDSDDESKADHIVPELDNGDTLIYCRDRHEDTVTLISHSFDPTSEILNYEIKFDDDRTLSTTREFLHPSDEPDTITLTSTIEAYKILAEVFLKKILHTSFIFKPFQLWGMKFWKLMRSLTTLRTPRCSN